jgi:riboflavin kinase/FMN adenylyltransferase
VTKSNSSNPKPVVVAIGVFDGVHAGHKYLINKASEVAKQIGGTLTVASFNPHPVSVLRPESFLGLITAPNFRSELLKQAGADRVEFIDFTQEVSRMTPDEFVEVVVLDQLKANTVVVGKNFRFGAKASGDVETLQILASKFGFEVEVINLAGDTNTWSSTRIRNHLLAGEVKSARELLGRPHRLTGEVIYGDQRGRELGYPTANLSINNSLIIPTDGVYSALLITKDEVLPAAVSIGTNPTFEGVIGRRVEAYALDRTDLDLYGQEVDLDFLDFVRPMVAFNGIEPLLAAMANDIEVTRGQINDFLDTPSH